MINRELPLLCLMSLSDSILCILAVLVLRVKTVQFR